MPVLALVGSIVAIDVVAKLAGQDTITDVLRRNRAETFIGIAWLAVHVSKRSLSEGVV
jgi:hypothetical protein